MTEDLKEIRFIAKSAKEAAEEVRERLGPNARVISVRQVTGTGLQRFLVSPRLEIVAREIAPVALEEVVVGGGELDARQPVLEAVSVVAEPEVRASFGPSCGELLERAGFPVELMARLEGAAEWRELQNLPAREGLPRAVAWLRRYRTRGSYVERPGRLAFIGGPGSGKTTSLCKYLAREVFLHGRKPEVLKLEVDKPHLDNGLSLYCEILDVRCHEDPEAVGAAEHLLVDVPGFSLDSQQEKRRVAEALDAIDVPHRIMVMNASYDAGILRRLASAGRGLGATYEIFTHLDELSEYGKLWSYVLDPGCETLFFANGQNVAGDIAEDAFGFLMERTFPR